MARPLVEVQVENIGRSPTFVVGSNRQRSNLDALQKREQHLSEAYQKNKPLCFNARAYQKTHPRKAVNGHRDADATLVSPMLVGVADGVSQIEDFGIDASELPNELLSAVEELAVAQLLTDADAGAGRVSDSYRGPIAMLREAYESTEAVGSTTVLMAIMDNSTRIHGKLHPMIAVLSVGDCEMMIIRPNRDGRYEHVFHTEMQRIDGHAQSPLQLARLDENIDPNFDATIDEAVALEVIERGSAVQCVSVYEGDVVVLGSDGVFDNLYNEEIVRFVGEMMPQAYPYSKFQPTDRAVMGRIARRIVKESHAKTTQGPNGLYPDAPIGRGGKVDDTSCVVGEIVEWTSAHNDAWNRVRRQKQWQNVFSCGLGVPTCDDNDSDEERGNSSRGERNYPSNPNGSFSEYGGSFASLAGDGSFYQNYQGNFGDHAARDYRGMSGTTRTRDDEEDDEPRCSVM